MTNLQKHGEAGVLFRNRWTATSWAHAIWQVWGKFRGPWAFLAPSIFKNANPVIMLWAQPARNSVFRFGFLIVQWKVSRGIQAFGKHPTTRRTLPAPRWDYWSGGLLIHLDLFAWTDFHFVC